MLKRCTNCGTTKNVAQFHKKKGSKDGFDTRCRQCTREYMRTYEKEWNKKNREKYLCQGVEKKRRLKNKVLSHYSHGTMSCKKCGYNVTEVLCVDHIEGGGTKERELYGNNTYQRLHTLGYPEGHQVLCMNCNFVKIHEQREFGNKDLKVRDVSISGETEKMCTACKAVKGVSNFYKDANRPDGLCGMCKLCKATRYRGVSAKSIAKKRLKAMDNYTEGCCCCKWCGYSDPRALTIDHVNGDGADHRKWMKDVGEKNWSNIAYWLEQNGYPEGFQILCMNCNWKKRVDNKEGAEYRHRVKDA